MAIWVCSVSFDKWLLPPIVLPRLRAWSGPGSQSPNNRLTCCLSGSHSMLPATDRMLPRGLKTAGVVLADAGRRQFVQPLGRAAMVQAERGGVMAAAQLDQHLLPGLVFQTQNVLQGQCPHGVKLIGGQVRAAQDVGVDFQGGRQVGRQGRAPETHVHDADALVAVESEVVQSQRQFPAVALAGAAGDEIAQHRRHAALVGRIVGATGRHQEVERRRADVRHALGEEREAVGEGMVMDVLTPQAISDHEFCAKAMECATPARFRRLGTKSCGSGSRRGDKAGPRHRSGR